MSQSVNCPECGIRIETEVVSATVQIVCANCSEIVDVSPPKLASGQVMAGFEIDRRIGSGAMGEVYLATQLSMQRKVALKVLSRDIVGNTEDVERFYKEVQTLAQLDHPNIVSAFEAGREGQNYFLAMTFVDGEDLDEILARENTIEEKRALKTCLHIADALKYVWDKHKILHRDIKPSNIMIDADGKVKLMDLGISKRTSEDSSLTISGMVLGTPYYMSPEQAKAQELDFRSDLYSLGATLYHMVTGEVAFPADTTMAVLTRLVTDPLPPPRELNPEISEGCEQLLKIMLAKSPDNRQQSWDELVADFKNVLAGRSPKSAKPVAIALSKHKAKPRTAAAVPAQAHAQAQARLDALTAAPQKSGGRPVVLLVAAIVLPILLLAALLMLFSDGDEPTTTNGNDSEIADGGADTTQIITDPEGKKPTDVDGAERRLKQLKRNYDRATAYAKRHPRDIAGVRAKFEALIAAAAGTPYEQRIEKALKRIAAAHFLMVDGTLKSLIDLAAKKGKSGSPEDLRAAARALIDYNGPYKKETKARRQNLGQEYLDKAEIVAAAEKQYNADARKILIQLEYKVYINRIAAELTQLNFHAASRLTRQMAESKNIEDYPGTCKDAIALVNDLSKIPTRIFLTFRGDVGKTIKIKFKGGVETVRIVTLASTEEVVHAEKLIRLGSGMAKEKKEFTVSDLSAKEKFTRLSGDNSPGATIMRGLLVMKKGKPQNLARWFEKVPNDLGEALTRMARLPWKSKDDLTAAATLDDILELAEVNERGDPSAIIGQLWNKQVTHGSAIALKEAVKKYRAQHGQSTVTLEYHDVLETLTRLATVSAEPESKQTGEEFLKRALAELERDNGGKVIKAHHELKSDGIRLNLEGNRNLTNLRALAAVPVVELNLKNTPVSNLAPLAHSPAKRLILSRTKVTDLSPLKHTRIEHLDLSGTDIEDLGPLEGLPLKTLLLHGCKRLKDLGPLMGSTTIQFLSVPKTAKNIDALEDMPALEYISYTGEKTAAADFFKDRSGEKVKIKKGIASEKLKNIRQTLMRANRIRKLNCTLSFDNDGSARLNLRYSKKLYDIGPLAGLPIVHLTLDYCPIPDLDALEGMALKSLSIEATGITDLGPVRDAPIESLNIKNTSIRDLSVLSEFPLKRLWMSGKYIDNLKYLSDSKQLKQLFIYDTSIKSLRPLKDLPLTVLHILNSPVDDISPLRGKELTSLSFGNTEVDNIALLRNMPLTYVDLHNTPVSNLQPLKALPIKYLNVNNTKIRSLTALTGKKIIQLRAANTAIRSVKELRGMPLTFLDISGTDVKDITLLQGVPLKTLNIANTGVRDLDDLKGMPLEFLYAMNLKIIDIGPLAGLPLKELRLDGTINVKDIEPLMKCGQLERVVLPPRAKNIGLLKKHPSIRFLNTQWDGWKTNFAKFWAKH